MAIDGAIAQYLENAGAVNHARSLRRVHDKHLMGWDVRTGGGLATTGTANGGVARHFGSATTGDFAVIQRAAGANMSVDVLLGGALVGGTESAHQGMYHAYNDASINVPITASDPTNPRIDLIVIRVRDTEYSGATDNCTVEVVTGTAAGVPAEPTIPANCLTLARVDVAAAAASIVTGNITDRRRNLAALGGITPCTSSSTYPTVNLWEGMVIYDRTLDAVLVYSGAAWIQIGPLSGWTAFTPTIQSSVGTITSYTIQGGASMRIGRGIMWRLKFTITDNGTGATTLQIVGGPVAPFSLSNMTLGVFRQDVNAGSTGIVAASAAGSTTWNMNNYDNSYPAATNSVLSCWGLYEAAA